MIKKILLICLIGFSFIGCKDIYDIARDGEYLSRAEGHSLYYLPEFEELDNFAKITIYMREHVVYKKDSGKDSWENPQTTLERGYGDCEDLAILFMNIAYFGMNIKIDLVLVVSTTQRTIVDGGEMDHAVPYFDGKIYEPLLGYFTDYDISYSYSFDTVFSN